MIKQLMLKGVGPAAEFDVEFATRLNLFTGDNGLGKTFLLDIAWWALTGTWAGDKAWPRTNSTTSGPERAKILTTVKLSPSVTLKHTSSFSYSTQTWPLSKLRAGRALVLYARVDGSFSVWDSARNFPTSVQSKGLEQDYLPKAYHFTPDNIWNGLESGDKVLCNGLIRDWVSWQNQPGQDEGSPFILLSKVMEKLSPHPAEWIKPGKPTRLALADVRDIPTVQLPYGTIPVTLASAGMKRILALAYLLVWTWYEHVQASRLIRRNPADSLVLIVDEVESHLHPQWQRSILPAVMSVASELKKKISTQLIVTTHSPLTLASVEPYFDEARDKLFLFALKDKDVELNEVPWAKQGDTVGWLTSDVFGLKQARSKDAEVAIEAAEAFMRGDMDALPEKLKTKALIHKELLRVLPGHDPFWPRWIVTAMGAGK